LSQDACHFRDDADFAAPKFDWVSTKRLGIAAGRSSLVIAQWMLLLFALERGHTVVVKAVSGTSPLFVLVFAFFFLKEKITWRKNRGCNLCHLRVGLVDNLAQLLFTEHF